VSPVKYELGFYIPEDDILHRHRRVNSNAIIPFGVKYKVCLRRNEARRFRRFFVLEQRITTADSS
jgi:hypothetical protein